MSITVKWKYEGYYSRTFATPKDLAEAFGLEDEITDDMAPHLAVEAFHDACDRGAGLIRDVLEEDSAGDNFWTSGEVDMEAVEAIP